MAPAAISKSELFERLAAGHAAGITVVTPNRRLAQVLRAEFDSHQISKKLVVWEDADILPLDAFVLRGYEDALYAEGGDQLPLLLSEAQSRELWEAAIAGSQWADALLDVPQTAARAMDAWRLAQAWNLAGALAKFAVNEDTRAFAEWAKAYAQRLRADGLTDAALLGSLDFKTRKPKLLVAYAFDIVPAQARDFFARFESASCSPEKRTATPGKIPFASPKEELEAAARWARARLEAGARKIGVVVPDLELRRREVARVFERVMGSQAPFNISIGEPLAGYPLVAFALGLLELSAAEMPFEDVSRLIRSPFLGGAGAEDSARALADARLRREAPATLSLPKLIGLLEGPLRERFEKIFAVKASNPSPRGLSPHDWARHFTALLAAAGFPGRALDSAEYQAQMKFNEVLGEFSRLALVTTKMAGIKAIHNLRRLCRDTLFQPEGAQAPVQVLGLLESAGIGFDALWLSGLSDDKWPLRARPNPFLPVALQRKAGIPEASAETALALDRRITGDWACAADEVVFSWARREEDRDLLPSPLILEFAERSVAIPEFPSHRDLIFGSGGTESYTDEKAPALAAQAVRGGTRVLADQAACPFRAYARHRLRADALDAPEAGPDAIDRGMLLHALMAGIWREAKTFAALNEEIIVRSSKAAVAGLGLEGRFAQLEEQRLVKLAREWLEVERKRAPFEVVHVEQKRSLSIGGLALSGRIDRMDRLADGTHAVIDYKTGARVTSRDWDGPRPDDPQLPLYAVTSDEQVSAAAFGKLRAGDMKFSGFSAAKGAIPGVQQSYDWKSMTAGWKAVLTDLARGFGDGAAAVDPKRGLTTCRNCDLHTLCRVHERLSALEEEEGDE